MTSYSGHAPWSDAERALIEATTRERLAGVFHDVIADLLLQLNLDFDLDARIGVGGTVSMVLVSQLMVGWARELATASNAKDPEDAFRWVCADWHRRLPDWFLVNFDIGDMQNRTGVEGDLRDVLGPRLAQKLAPIVFDTIRAMELALNVWEPEAARLGGHEAVTLAVLVGVARRWAMHHGVLDSFRRQAQWTAMLASAVGTEIEPVERAPDAELTP